VVVTQERVVVCSGFGQALELLSQLLRAQGLRSAATEAYGPALHRRILEAAGLECQLLEVDGGGAAVDSIGEARCVLLTPAHQFPIGVPLKPARRRRAVQSAMETDGLIIEDDYDGEFRYDRHALAAMQGLAPNHHVVYG
jgi:GntR family transcriptional regulator/MocR family aminotransferase